MIKIFTDTIHFYILYKNVRMLYGLGLSISILYLIQMTRYRLYDYNSFESENWFIHPEQGSCVFGQLMAILTCLLIVILFFYPNSYLLILLSILWCTIPYLMNNTWLSIWSFPLALIWLTTASLK